MVPHQLAVLCLLVTVAARSVGAQSAEPPSPATTPAKEQAPPRDVSGGPTIAEQECFDVQHYDLAIKVQPDTHRIDGVLTMRPKALTPCPRLAHDLDPALDATA